jgi:hypothetical protein
LELNSLKNNFPNLNAYAEAKYILAMEKSLAKKIDELKSLQRESKTKYPGNWNSKL